MYAMLHCSKSPPIMPNIYPIRFCFRLLMYLDIEKKNTS